MKVERSNKMISTLLLEVIQLKSFSGELFQDEAKKLEGEVNVIILNNSNNASEELHVIYSKLFPDE